MFLIAIMKIKKSEKASRGYDQKMQYLKINHIIKAIAHFEKNKYTFSMVKRENLPS